jgi:excisionase family DNA binding protein
MCSRYGIKKDLTLLDVCDLIDILGIGRSKAYELVKSGKIRAFKIGKRWKITQDAVDEFILMNEGLF